MTKQSKTTICVIDDDESVRRALLRLLKSAGYSVKAHASARAFLDCEICGSCLLILDIQMPEIDGFELAGILSESGSKFPIIFITAQENPQLREKAMNSGAFAFLQKPFNGQELLDAVQRWISGIGLRPGSASA
ncbi:MAG: response regulator [Syntrophobacteraceae bacterium]